MKAVVAQFIFESNTFNREEAGLDLFKHGGVWRTGEDAVRRWADGADSQLAGSVRELEAAGWQAHPVFAAVCGTPAGRLSREAFATIRTTLRDNLLAAPRSDAMLLHLHGAACAVGEDDVEGNLLEMVRRELGFAGRLAVSLDLHANVTRRMTELADGVTAYRTMPHTDFAETGRRAARLLIDSRPTRRVLVKLAALIPPTDTSDAQGRFAEMLQRARELEKLPGVLDVSLFPVQPWLDIAEMGTALVATATREADIEAPLRKLGEAWYAQRHDWQTGSRPWPGICDTLKAGAPKSGPWILVDAADATTGGSPGTSAEAIAQLWPLREELPGEVLLWVVDVFAVTAASRGETSFHLGDRRFPVYADVILHGEGRFRARGQAYTGQEFSMGPVAVLKAGRLRIVLSCFGTLCADPAFYECVNLNPDAALAVQVKSLMGWRAGYGAGPERGLAFDGPGLTSLDFKRLPFRGERRDLFPLNSNPSHPISLWPSP